MKERSWNRTVWKLAGPVILSNISIPLLGIVDTAVIGQLTGAHYIGAVAIGAQIFAIIYWSLSFLRMGTTGLTAQSLGSGDLDQVRTYLLRSSLIAIIAGIVIIILQRPIMWGALAIIGPSDEVAKLADTYFSIRIWGAPAVFMGYAILGWFIGIQNTSALLLLQIAVNALNIVLDLIFVLGFSWGVEGVAFATVISEFSGLIFGIWLVVKIAKNMDGEWRIDLIQQWDRLIHMISINRDIFLRTLCLETAFVTFTAIGARMGDTLLAANAVLLLFQSFMAYGLDGFAHAVETLTGQAYGAKDKEQFKGTIYASFVWSIGFSIPIAISYLFLGEQIINILSKTQEVREVAYIYLPWIAILPIISVWSFLLDGIFYGLTQTVYIRNAMIVSLAVYLVSVIFVVDQLGNHGLWLSLTILMIARAVTLGAVFPKLFHMIERGPKNI